MLPYSVSSYMETKERCDSSRLAGEGCKKRTIKPKPTAKYLAMVTFKAISFLIDSDSKNNPRPNKTASDPYAPIFLGHVRLYILAEKYDMDSFRRLSLHRLRQILMVFTVYDENVPDLIGLVDEIYEYTVEGSWAREIISKYLSFFVEHIRQRDDFRDPLRRVNDFAQDLMERMVQRLD